MKTYVLYGLTLMLVCFIAGGIYIARSIHDVTDKLEKVVSFHKVEFLRKTLEHHIEAVQDDLLIQGSPHSRSFESSVSLIEAMEDSATVCTNCHHSETTTKRLDEFEIAVQHYMKLLSRTMTLRANRDRVENARLLAYSHGKQLLQEVEKLSSASAGRIAERISKIQGDIHSTNNFLVACLILGPVTILIITAFFLKRFTGSIDTLVAAAENLKKGDLNYRIKQPLKNEFQTLANAFNGMAVSLKEEQKKFYSIHQSYQTLFETAGEAIMITGFEKGLEGQIISANKAACDLYGYSIDEMLVMNIVDLIPYEKKQKYLEKAELSGTEWTHQRVRRRKKDGSSISVSLSMGPLILNEEKHLLSFARDITDQLRAENEMQRANQMALVGQMSAGLAHEIKNPLAGIKVSLDVLADDLDLKPDDKELFARIINEINRMERLLKSLLNYARPPQPQFDRVDINKLLDNSIKNVSITSNGRVNGPICFEKTFDESLPRIEVDSSQLQQVFLNILLNAVDAIEAKGTIHVISRVMDEKHIEIILTDSGKGMSTEELEKVFDPFFTTKTKGTGLGLPICKRLVEQHGGQIEVVSQINRGTTFTITLPFEQ